ncbi:NUDIX hydrolase [Haladaptatus salinisoli]|uniref:NUDIX hydrolase n=1 Tax=Haladaptatus salinisoli TaxID=2884876 RepID=UPI001D0A6469|nr:NUDIX hydrolase [Haladaptatus salinisoli]
MDELSDIRGRGDVREGSRTLSLDADEFAGVERAIESGYDRWVGAAVTDDDGRVLFVENGWSDGWIVPGGDREIRRVSEPAGDDCGETIEPAETLEEAAVREVAEETGVAVELDRPLAVERQTFAHDGDDVSGWFVLFGGRAAEPTISDDLGVDGETIRDARWFAELPETPYRDDIESFRD